LTGSPVFAATNYDRQIAVCYSLVEYQGIASAKGAVYDAWGDMRNELTEPTDPLDPISGQTHTEEDVFFQTVKVQWRIRQRCFDSGGCIWHHMRGYNRLLEPPPQTARVSSEDNPCPYLSHGLTH
jgi:hypothetical protein